MTKHFQPHEFACHCGCGEQGVSDDLLELLENIREAVKEPIIVLSGRRCEKRNRAVGGKERSQHLLGNAADIKCASLSPKELGRLIETRFNPKGMGIYATFVHVDVRPGGRARW